MSAPQPWSSAFDYIQWYFRVSHPYMTPDTHRDPPMPTYQEILEEEEVGEDHVV